MKKPHLVGWDTESVGHLTSLNSTSAGNLDTSCITVLGEKVMDEKKNFDGTRPWSGRSQITDNT